MIKEAIDHFKLETSENFILKVQQLYEQLNLRHGVFIIGEKNFGKNTLVKVLEFALKNGKKEQTCDEVISLSAGTSTKYDTEITVFW